MLHQELSSYDDHDRKLLACLAGLFLHGGSDKKAIALNVSDLSSMTGIDGKEVQQKVSRFNENGWVDFSIKSPKWKEQYVTPHKGTFAAVETLGHSPPPRDLWAELTAWAKSKPWFIAVMLIGVNVSWMAGAIAVMKFVIDWLGIFQTP